MNTANVVMRVWGIGGGKFKDDYKRRLILFDSLVVGVILYRIELFGWKERGYERLHQN